MKYIFKSPDRFLILCEDKKSSKDYFESYKKDEELKRQIPALDIRHAKHYNNTVKFIEEAIELKKFAEREENEYTEVWAVFDKDFRKKEDLEDAIKLAGENRIIIALSVICFEVWLILHFENTNRCFTKPAEALKHLQKYLPEYKKNKICFEKIKPYTLVALKNAKILEQFNKKDNPKCQSHQYATHTDLHRLVGKLYRLNK